MNQQPGAPALGSWLALLAAGLLEVSWAALLPATDGFRRAGPTALLLAAGAGSFYLLSVATRGVPVSVAYPVWVGIGAVGTVAVGVLARGEPFSAVKALAVGAIVLGIAVVGWR